MKLASTLPSVSSLDKKSRLQKSGQKFCYMKFCCNFAGAGTIDAKAYYAYFAQAEQQDILHKEVLEETGETWVVLDAGSLPF